MSLFDEIDQVIQEEERKNSRTVVKRVGMQRVRRPVNPTYFAIAAAWMITRYKKVGPALVVLGILGFFLTPYLLIISVLGAGLYAYASKKLPNGSVQKPQRPMKTYASPNDKDLTILNIFEEDVWRLVKKVSVGKRKKLPGEKESWKDWEDAFKTEEVLPNQPTKEQVGVASDLYDEYYFED
jgi:hypothetical protein